MDLDVLIGRVKRGASICLASLIFVSSGLPKDGKSFQPTLCLKLTGGWGSALPEKDDIDLRLESVNSTARFEYWREVDPSRVIGEIKPLNNHLPIPEWEAELRTTLGPHIILGFATSPPHKKTIESSIRYIQVPGEEGQIVDLTYRPIVKVWPPIKFRLYYFPFHESRINISVNGGIGIYPTEIEEYFAYGVTFPSGDFGLTERYTDAAARFPLGFQGGFYLEYCVSRNLAFVVETEWRQVKLSHFKGRGRYFMNEWTADGELTYSIYDENEGTLYYFTMVDLNIGSRFADIEVWDRIPDVSIYFFEDIRKVRLDLSRFSIRIGFKIRLF